MAAGMCWGWMTGVSGFNRHELGQTSGDGEGQEDWCATVYGITKSRTQLGDRTTTTLLDLGTCSWPIFQAVVLKTVLF